MRRSVVHSEGYGCVRALKCFAGLANLPCDIESGEVDKTLQEELVDCESSCCLTAVSVCCEHDVNMFWRSAFAQLMFCLQMWSTTGLSDSSLPA